MCTGESFTPVEMPNLKFKSCTDHWVEDISHPGVNDSRQVEQAIFIILTLVISRCLTETESVSVIRSKATEELDF